MTMVEVGKEYGAALYLLACEEGTTDTYLESIEWVTEVLLAEEQFLTLLSSPSISLQERLAVIDTTFAEKVPSYLLSFMKLLCEKGRIPCLMEAFAEFKALVDASRRIYTAVITTSVPLTDEEMAKLVAKLEEMKQGKVKAEYHVDPSLLGGVIVEMDGKIMDGSLRHRLVEMKEVMNS